MSSIYHFFIDNNFHQMLFIIEEYATTNLCVFHFLNWHTVPHNLPPQNLWNHVMRVGGMACKYEMGDLLI